MRILRIHQLPRSLLFGPAVIVGGESLRSMAHRFQDEVKLCNLTSGFLHAIQRQSSLDLWRSR